MAGASTPAIPEPFDDTTGVVANGTSGPDPAYVHCRSRHSGGRAVGAHILGWRRARDLTLCQCCSDVMEAGDIIFDAEQHGERLVVCADCAGPT